MNPAMWRTHGRDKRVEDMAGRDESLAGARRLARVWVPLVTVVTLMGAVCLVLDAPSFPLRSILVQQAGAVLETLDSPPAQQFPTPPPQPTGESNS